MCGRAQSAHVGWVVRKIAPTAPCTTCTLGIDTLAAIRIPPEMGLTVRLPKSAAIDRHGNVLMTFTDGGYRIGMFSSAGRFLRAIIPPHAGLVTDGDLILAIDAADSLIVIDNFANRFWIFAPDYSLARMGPFGAGYALDVVHLASGDFLVAGDVQTPQSVGMPLHLVGPGGNLERSFGADDTVYVSRGTGWYSHVITLAQDGSVWSTSKRAIALRHWDKSFAPVEQLELENGKLSSWNEKPRDSRSKIEARVISLLNQPCGVLEIVSHVPVAVPWGDPGYDTVSTGGRGPQLVVHSPDRTYRTVIDVVDIRQARQIGSFRLPINLVRAFRDGRAIASATDNLGVWHTDVVRLRLRGFGPSADIATRPCVAPSGN